MPRTRYPTGTLYSSCIWTRLRLVSDSSQLLIQYINQGEPLDLAHGAIVKRWPPATDVLQYMFPINQTEAEARGRGRV